MGFFGPIPSHSRCPPVPLIIHCAYRANPGPKSRTLPLNWSTTLSNLPDLDFADLNAKFPARFAAGRSTSRDVHPGELIEDVGELGPEHIAEAAAHEASGQVMGVNTPTIKNIRATHHRIARLIAIGMKDTQIAAICNCSPNRLSHFRNDPAAQQLIAFYTEEVGDAFHDFVRTANDMSMDFMHELGERLERSPESFTPATLLEAVRTLADRSGNGAQSKTVNVNVNLGMGDRLRLAAKRAQEARRIGGSSTSDG